MCFYKDMFVLSKSKASLEEFIVIGLWLRVL